MYQKVVFIHLCFPSSETGFAFLPISSIFMDGFSSFNHESIELFTLNSVDLVRRVICKIDFHWLSERDLGAASQSEGSFYGYQLTAETLGLFTSWKPV